MSVIFDKQQGRRAAFAALGLVLKMEKQARGLFEELEERGRLRVADAGDYLDRVIERIKGEWEDIGDIGREMADGAGGNKGAAADGGAERSEI